MAPSQLKQLKASLRENGILGPQKSKKHKKATAKDAQKRSQRHAALGAIREQFNPFEVKSNARKEKFEFASGKPSKSVLGRPGVTRALGEERRRDTLLREMQSRNKVGGLLDRRFGESDPTMTPEQRAAERFARENERRMKKNSMFNLEDDSDEELTLTHGGRSLDFGQSTQDDFDTEDLDDSVDVEADFEGLDDRPRKRAKTEGADDDSELDEELPQRKKTKNEVMKEIIAKSKMYKAERQAAKADDDDLRAELDKGMSDFYEALRGQPAPKKQPQPDPTVTADEPHMDPARAAILAGKSREDAEKEYEANLKQLKLEARSKPSVRTKTDEEKAAEEAARLQDLQRKRIRRMKGEAESSEDEEVEGQASDKEGNLDDADYTDDDAHAFGLSAPNPMARKELDVEDEDEFILDDDLIASDSEAEAASEDSDDIASADEPEDDGNDDFINGLVLPRDVQTSLPAKTPGKPPMSGNLAYTFPCPQSHKELLDVVGGTKVADLPTIVQRIRALYHKGLAEGNQEKLDVFAGVLLQHIAHLADTDRDVPFSVLESLLRHLHSMSKSSPETVGAAFRRLLEDISEERPLKLTPGDLVMLTGVSTIFPTSDHFHSVVTPAMLSISRYLGQSSVDGLKDLGVGAYCCSLALRYQQLAKRYIPEVVTYITNALAILAPTPMPTMDTDGNMLSVPIRLPQQPLRVKSKDATEIPLRLSFRALVSASDEAGLRPVHELALLNTFVQLTIQVADLWNKRSAFPELIVPLIHALRHIAGQKAHLPSSVLKSTSAALAKLVALRATTISGRSPLLLHKHRPLAIKSSLPQFIENYNPDRHYDPDRERAELSKLKAEHKKERKGAMREIRKDANFIARTQLKEKKEKDAAYDRKFKRLVAEIQGEEGAEAKKYDREKERRKKSRF